MKKKSVSKAHKTSQMDITVFEQLYPRITEWVQTHGWIELGQIDGMPTFIMALDEGGLVWEGKKKYKTLDEAFRDLDEGLSEWMGS
jgi:hypothetical protein